MNRLSRIVIALLVIVWSYPVLGQSQQGSISSDEIVALNTNLTTATKAASKARKKLAIRRIIREGEALIKKNPTALKRFEVLNILFKSYQSLLKLDNSTTNRKTFLETCKKLAEAPDEYAKIRLDADLLLTQATAARKGANPQGRSDALRPLVERYRNTSVETKVIQIAMIMGLELGNTRLVNDLRETVAERFPGDPDLIKFQQDKLATQVFGAPFIGTFERSDGCKISFPMDFLGTTTMMYFWTKKGDGLEDLKALAEAWKAIKDEKKAAGRYQIVAMCMDDLPDAGESILRGFGLDWLALKVPGGHENSVYKTYVRRSSPTIMVMSPSGYVAFYSSGGRSTRTWDRRLQSMMSRTWARAITCNQLQSFFAGEFMVMSPDVEFDPAIPPEYRAALQRNSAQKKKLPRTAKSVPEDKLRAVQACFIQPPFRYTLSHSEIVENYKKADALCRSAIADHPDAPDLWIVRNRRIAALMGLWKSGDQKAFSEAVTEAKALVKSGCPKGTDVLARLCLAREELRAPDVRPKKLISKFIESSGGQQASGPALTAALLLSLDTGDRLIYDKLRQTYLNSHAETPAMWTATAFLLDRYQQYWLFHPPFTAGWTYGRRQGYFLSIGKPEEAQRSFKAEFRTFEGEAVQIPESNGKWTLISFVKDAGVTSHLVRYTAFTESRPFDDVKLISAVLDDNAEAAIIAHKGKNKPEKFPVMLIPRGRKNPVLRKLGIVMEEKKANILILRPDGSIALSLSGSSMSNGVIQNVIERQDEKNVDAALANGDLDEAKRLAFALAPLEPPAPKDPKKKPKPLKISVPHLRSRAKVYFAMGKLKEAFADIDSVYLVVNSKAGYISMRTKELEETEALKTKITDAMKQAEPAK